MFRHLLFLCLFHLLILTGCASLVANKNSVVIKDVDWPLGELRGVVGSVLPAGVRGVSSNGREMLSKHFVIDGRNGYRAAGDATERYFATVLILGDRRPYTLEVLVTAEKRVLRSNQFTYVIDGYDPRLAKELEKKVRAELTKRREDLNIIDDFRVF